jgi:glycosyltransferase involved in cell wall biosynthesis
MADTRPATANPTPPASRIAVVVPCYNEEAAIAKVVGEFAAQPGVVEVLVVDNASTDRTVELARAAGARVVTESRPGKGFALLTGFRAVREADFVVMVDGDDTYPAESLPQLVGAAESGADMVIGTRLAQASEGSLPRGHGLGNRLFIALVRVLFGLRTQDLFSGYRVLSRRFLQTVPLVAIGFEVELEISLQALQHGFRIAELPVPYRPRPAGSYSKLRTYRDGYRILTALILFFRDLKPLTFFGVLAGLLLALSLSGGAIVVSGYLRTGLVLRLPLAVLSAALFLLSALSLACGVLLSSINRRAAEIEALFRLRDRP